MVLPLNVDRSTRCRREIPGGGRRLKVGCWPDSDGKADSSSLWYVHLDNLRFTEVQADSVGAGISTATGIPDFRSSEGLFGKGKGKVKDLFHVRSLSVSLRCPIFVDNNQRLMRVQSSTLLPEHHNLLNELASLSASADPSAFHTFLSHLDTEGRLLRCYTQNIDGLEARAGLEVGIPARRTRSSPKKGALVSLSTDGSRPPTPGPSPGPCVRPAPRCIPLHGQLTHLYCPLCPTIVPLSNYLPLPPNPIPCPTCNLSSSIRHALSERQRKVGSLRASVVLYGEEHPQGEMIGSVVERDLRGTGRKGEKEGKVDLLLVVGTSLAIPGVKRIVKEMARSLTGPGLSSPGGSSSQEPRSILVNRELPKGAEWDGIFDTFISGDIQDFTTQYLTNPAFETPAPQIPRTPRKRKVGNANGTPPTPDTTPSRRVAKSVKSPSDGTPTKRRRVELEKGVDCLPLTPRPTPPRRKIDSSTFDRPSCRDERAVSSDTPLTPISDIDSEDQNPFFVAR